MSIKLKKNWLIISFSIVLFLISIGIARADLVITVKFDDGCTGYLPLPSGVFVEVAKDMDITDIVCAGFTSKNGKLTCQSSELPICPYRYWYQVKIGGVVKDKGPADVDETCTGSANSNLAESCPSGYCVDGYCCDSACDGNCDRCDVSGSEGTCTDVDAECTGNCDYCSFGNCAPDESICEALKCSDCTGSGTSFSCTYDETENEDCNPFDIEGIATCYNIPDDYDFTWDYREAFDSQCIGLDSCSQGDDTITHTCHDNVTYDGIDGNTCGAQCDNVGNTGECGSNGICLADCTCEITTIEGDLNLDCEVNVLDLILVGRAYDSTPEDSHWNQIADVAPPPYGAVDLLDLIAVGTHIGDTCP